MSPLQPQSTHDDMIYSAPECQPHCTFYEFVVFIWFRIGLKA